ncbi:hypothetical protein GCM10008018_58490 [Paenibacillus marchantiophytorum]|uniref:Type II secretion system protein GspF domain-containing protein n=1 Tax=Paenibacillus marchantiophytorum TaxID=1619310 RepID=A0ABQ1FBG2_9BACL|nr:hypothetical protein [Paenibacillus marchantiophytorum]GGA04911.1 hypothetical protein GCM10008018_58490 [Paenibacillus marchantiophytorum]
MSIQNMIAVILISLVSLLGVLLLLLLVVQNKMQGSNYQEQKRILAMMAQKPKDGRWLRFCESMYPYLLEIPVIRNMLLRIRSRLMIIHAGDENIVRGKAASITSLIIGLILIILIFSFILTSAWSTRFAIVLTSLYIGSFMSDMFIGRTEKQMLRGEAEMILDIRHEYHQTHRVRESIERSSERSKPIVAAHARKIAEILEAVDPEEELRIYYDVAPNRYMKQLAGVSYKISEYGDADVTKGEKSLYLQALGNIREEIHMDVSRRDRLDRMLAGIVFVAVSPVFMLEPMRKWSESQFPIVSNYYNSAWGLYSLILLYVIYIASFFALRVVKGLDGDAQAVQDEGKWLNRLLKFKWLYSIVDRVVPAEYEGTHFKVSQQLKDANSKLTLHAFYLQKFLFAVFLFIGTIVSQVYIHEHVKHNLVYPNQEIMTGGNQSSSQVLLSRERYEFEVALVNEILAKNMKQEEIVPLVIERIQGNNTFLPYDLDRNKYALQISKQVSEYRNEYYRWYELIIAFFLAVVSYQLPNLIMTIKKQMRMWEMQNEVDGFNTIVMMLSRIPSITVYEIIEWFHRYSYIFNDQLLRCTLDYEAGAWQALENLKDDARFIPLERLADRLQVAAELIPVKDAFDDMEIERSFAMEQRKEYYEKMVTNKSTIGNFIGFVPLSATFALYLLIPFVYLAFQQLGELTTVTNTM